MAIKISDAVELYNKVNDALSSPKPKPAASKAAPKVSPSVSAAEQAQRDTFKAFGNFEPANGEGFKNTQDAVNQAANTQSRTWSPPPAVHPWECRIGGARFMVPPLNVSVDQTFQAGTAAGSLRQQSPPRFNSGHSQTVVNMTLYFPSHEAIWGFDGDRLTIDFDKDSDEVIDKFLGSLRGLVAQFKYAPFLPVKNAYLNSVYNINAVAMRSLTVSSVPNFPFVLAVNLQLLKFNHKVYLPMVENFDDAIHWGRFRQYIGRAAKKMQEVTEKAFLSPQDTTPYNGIKIPPGHLAPEDRAAISAENKAARLGNSTVFDKVIDYNRGSNIELFYPDHDPARVIGPDLGFWDSNVPQQGNESWWKSLTKYIGISPEGIGSYANIVDYPNAKELSNEYRLLFNWLKSSKVAYDQMNSAKMNEYVSSRIKNDLPPNASDAQKEEVKLAAQKAWYGHVYKNFLNDPYLAKILAFQQFARGQVQINEWEVPMRKLGLDNPNVLVNNVSVSMANNIVPLQLSMQASPTYQHVGGMGASISISLTVFGEEDLARIRLMYETIGGLAMLEHGRSVLGFLGVKNVITALCGVKYCIPQTFNVNTISDYPHVYTVELGFLDFDVFQQKREILSSEQQAELIEAFSKRNPFLRIKQQWGAFNAYPDFPLSVRDDGGKIQGHFDPDYYFRSFKMIDDDIVNWRQKKVAAQAAGDKSYDVVHHFGNLSADGTPQSIGVHANGFDLLDNNRPVASNCDFNEPHPGNMLQKPFVPGCTPGSYMQPYHDNAGNPNSQFDMMMKDHQYRDNSGRMIRAFPTFMLWLIDEGGVFAGMKMFDNFYGLQSVIDMSIVQSEDCMGDTMQLRISNLYSRLSTDYKDLVDEKLFPNSAKIYNTSINRKRNQLSGFTDYLVELETVKLQPGVRLHMRMGYSANPNKLETVFNGVITQVEQGEVITITAQSDCIELSPIVNNKNKGGQSGKIDGSLMSGFWMSEPRDLMTRLLSMGGSTFRETVSHATHGMIYSENRFGIRHFGTLLYEPMGNEGPLTDAREKKMTEASASWANFFTEGGALGSVANFLSAGIGNLVGGLWINFHRKRDYELYKRNIYPGNGTGVAQYMGGDLGDGGLANAFQPVGVTPEGQVGPADPKTGLLPPPTAADVSKAAKQGQPGQGINNPSQAGAAVAGALFGSASAHPFMQMLGITNEVGDDDIKGMDEVSFRAQTYMKSVWDLFMICAALLPNYIVAVRPFEHRSTVFYGKPHWMYTSGVIPLTKGVRANDPAAPKQVGMNQDGEAKFLRDIENEAKKRETIDDFYSRISSMGEADFKGNHAAGASGGDPTGSLAGMPWGGGDISKLPQVASSGAKLPAQRGAITQEMHLPTSGNISTDIAQHKQLAELPKNLRHPYYMDRVGGGAGGYAGFSLAGQNQGSAGKPGAFGYLNPTDEQWYMNMRWHYASTGGGQKIAGQTQGQLKGRRVMVYNERTKKGVVCTPGEYGPHGSTSLVAGVSPDSFFALGAKQGDVCWFGWVSDSTQLGPVNFTSAAQFKGTGLPAGNAVAAPGGTATGTGTAAPKTSDIPWMKDAGSLTPADYALKYGGQKDIPVDYTDPKLGLVDERGKGASQVYKGQRSDEQADEIWGEFRKHFPNDEATKNEYKKHRPNQDSKYNATVQEFIRFMWSNPYHRGWIVQTADAMFTLGSSVTGDAANLPVVGGAAEAVGEGIDRVNNAGKAIGDALNPFNGKSNHDSRKWDFDRAHGLFGRWLDNPATAVEWMKQNSGPGKDQRGLIGRAVEEFKTKIWDNIVEFFSKIRKAVGSLATGIVSLMRMGIMSLTGALNMASWAGRQANLLNKVFNDSLYYQAGPPGSLLYHADNVFTREYGEPVVEIRQPFQRVHHIDSFGHIINNGIIENSEGVSTVVTAVSNGKHPVTVHFDKGAPSEKQVESSVETGLMWDSPGILGKVLHPIQSLQSFSTHFNNGDQETSAKRVALWHLKESLKDIYSGEVIILGDPTIRPHDLLHIGDVYNRIYGMCEVEQVVHHFTPQTGFITSITPNAIVTINDPARWKVGTVMRKWYATMTLRRELREQLGVKTGMARLFSPQDETDVNELMVKRAESALKGSVQYHGGASAILKDIGGMAGIGGIVGGSLGGTVGGLAGGFLGWKAFGWVRDNILDAHGCYIQYLNKNGRPMDAGLSYNHGVAVGQVRGFTLLKDSLGIFIPRGGAITSNELFEALGWSEYQIEELQNKDIDMWTDSVKKDILKISGRVQEASPFIKPRVEYVNVVAAERGDSIIVSPAVGGSNRVKLLFVRSAAGKTEEMGGDSNGAAERARKFTEKKLILEPQANGHSPTVALRINPTSQVDQFGQIQATIFHNLSPSIPPAQREIVLREQALAWPRIQWDSYLPDGRPYSFNWDICLSGHADIDTSQTNRSLPGQGVIGAGL